MSSTRRPTVALAAPLLLLGLAVNGCGVADTQGAPGSAARVGDETITVAEVDDLTDDLCSLSAEREELSEGVQARGAARRNLLEGLVVQAAVRQVLDDTGTELGSDYQAALDVSRDQAAQLGLDEEQSGIYSDINGIGAYITAGVTALGGEDPLLDWFKTNDVTINPVFGLRVGDDGLLVDTGTGTSVPVSDVARASQDAGAEYLEALPDEQTCG